MPEALILLEFYSMACRNPCSYPRGSPLQTWPNHVVDSKRACNILVR